MGGYADSIGMLSGPREQLERCFVRTENPSKCLEGGHLGLEDSGAAVFWTRVYVKGTFGCDD